MITVMYAPDDLRVMGVCDGPAAAGQCPRVAPGEEVPCWGFDLVLSGSDVRRAPGIDRPRFRVAPATTVCPVAQMRQCLSYFGPFTPQD